MRAFTLYFLLLVCFALKAQDKVFLLNGTLKQGKVLEVGTEWITMTSGSETRNIYRYEIAAIEFQNGTIEIINEPKETLVFNNGSYKGKGNQETKLMSLYKPHFGSVNSLALYNADISVFYEYIPKSKTVGVGIMGAYNFNLYSTIPNLFITSLNNAKKNYDIGLTFNYYPMKFENKTTYYMGVMFKYMNFSFDRTKTDSIITPTTRAASISYIPSTGNQLATIVTIGTHTKFNETFYIRTIGGLGAFRLKGDYKEEYNKLLNNDPKQTRMEYNYLPKFYFGINIGFNL